MKTDQKATVKLNGYDLTIEDIVAIGIKYLQTYAFHVQDVFWRSEGTISVPVGDDRLCFRHADSIELRSNRLGISAIDINHEYNTAAVKAGLSAEEIHQSQKNALECAFLSDSEKKSLISAKSQ